MTVSKGNIRVTVTLPRGLVSVLESDDRTVSLSHKCGVLIAEGYNCVQNHRGKT